MLANDILRGTHAHVGDDGFDFDRYENVNEHMNNVSHMPMSWYMYIKVSKWGDANFFPLFCFLLFCFFLLLLLFF